MELPTDLPGARLRPTLPRTPCVPPNCRAAAEQRNGQTRGVWKRQALRPDVARCNSKPRCTEPYLLGPACRMRRGSPLTGFSGRPCAHSKGRFDLSATARETVQRPEGSCWRLGLL